jgi:hypothetical protein
MADKDCVTFGREKQPTFGPSASVGLILRFRLCHVSLFNFKISEYVYSFGQKAHNPFLWPTIFHQSAVVGVAAAVLRASAPFFTVAGIQRSATIVPFSASIFYRVKNMLICILLISN